MNIEKLVFEPNLIQEFLLSNQHFKSEFDFQPSTSEQNKRFVTPVRKIKIKHEPAESISVRLTSRLLNERAKCCYCGQMDILSNMTAVTKDPTYLTEWTRILGIEFYEKSMSHTKPRICRSHFDVQFGAIRPRHVLPVATKKPEIEESDNQKLTGNARKCTYCGELKKLTESTFVPKDPIYLSKWTEILGIDFYMRTISQKHPRICRSHFNRKFVRVKPFDLLPVPLEHATMVHRVNGDHL